MIRSRVSSAGFVACALALTLSTGCSSSDDSPPAAPTTTQGASADKTIIGVPVCTLVPSDQVNEVLGRQVVGVETDSFPYYKNCEWKSGSSSFRVGAIRLGNGQVGFFNRVVNLTPTAVTGLGNRATFSFGKNADGASQGLLVTNQGTVSLSISLTKPSIDRASELKDQLVKVARSVFAQLGA